MTKSIIFPFFIDEVLILAVLSSENFIPGQLVILKETARRKKPALKCLPFIISGLTFRLHELFMVSWNENKWYQNFISVKQTHQGLLKI